MLAGRPQFLSVMSSFLWREFVVRVCLLAVPDLSVDLIVDNHLAVPDLSVVDCE
jgi:hypothetical protein